MHKARDDIDDSGSHDPQGGASVSKPTTELESTRCRLLELPPELRLIIYDLVWPETLKCVLDFYGSPFVPADYEPYEGYYASAYDRFNRLCLLNFPKRRLAALTQTCRTIHHEASDVLLDRVQLVIPVEVDTIVWRNMSKNKSPLWNNVKHVALPFNYPLMYDIKEKHPIVWLTFLGKIMH